MPTCLIPLSLRARLAAMLATAAVAAPVAAAAADLPAAVAGMPFVGCDGQAAARDSLDWTLVATGDLVPADSQQANARSLDPFLPVFRAGGLVLGNLEGAITTHPTPRKRYVPGRSYAFRFPPATAQLFKDANFHVMSVANNHAHDYGPVGFQDTARLLAQVGIDTTGLPGTIAMRQVGGLKVAVVAMAHYAAFNNVLDLDRAAQVVAKAKAQADLVVVYYQLGAEGAAAAVLPQGPETFLGESRGDARAFAQRMVQAGAGVLIGHGPHVLRAAECIAGTPVLHSIGNFLSHGGLSVQGLPGITALPEFLFDASGKFKGVRVHSVAFGPDKLPQFDPNGRGAMLMNWLSRRAQADHPGFKPLVLPTIGMALEEFERWAQGNVPGPGARGRANR